MEANQKIAVVLGACALVFSSFALSANNEEGKAAPFVSCGTLTEPQIAAQVKSDLCIIVYLAGQMKKRL